MTRPFLRYAPVMIALSGLAGCGGRAGGDIIVKVAGDGTFEARGEELSKTALRDFLAGPKDETARAQTVVISAAPECEYRHVQEAMHACMTARVDGMTWEMAGRRFAVKLHAREARGGSPLPPPDKTSLLDPSAGHRGRVWSGKMVPPPRAGVCQEPRALRVRLFWANARGRMIHGPERASPPEFPGVLDKLTTDGAHIEMRLNHLRCANLGQIESALAICAPERPDWPVIVDARRAVPFRLVFEAAEACKKAGVEIPKIQAPPGDLPGGGSGWDWVPWL